MDTYQVLYIDSNDVRRTVELKLSQEDRVKLVGITRYTSLDMANGSHEAVQNGTYPIIDATTFNDIYGKVLTVCDAAFSDDKQREAVKSLLKTTLSDWYSKQVDYTATMTDQSVNAEKPMTNPYK